MNDLRLVFTPRTPGVFETGLQMKWFLLRLEGDIGFENDKIINFRAQFVQANIQPVKLRVNQKHVIDFSTLIARSVDVPAPPSTEVSGLMEREKPKGSI